mmetsp:Transcript_78690/g.230873  ORF Transcript_78690/g.230873 Transcript_78690/m.230873 type:complete len:178 (+) Transcript_78690:147-680(+)
MAGLRGVTNHYALHAGSRSDFQILANPEYRLGKEGTKCGVSDRYDARRCATRPAKSMMRDKMTASMRLGASRLVGPREHGMSLQDRALARTTGTFSRSMSLPASGSRSPGASWRTIAARMEGGEPQRLQPLEHSPTYRGARGDGTVGRFKYIPPPECVEIMQNWSAAKAGSGFDGPL